MNRKWAALALAAMMLALTIPLGVSADGERIMYVYTDNGKSLHVRQDPMIGNNIIAELAYGEAVSVRMTSASGWATIDWINGYGGVAYVMSRYLVDYKPGGRTPVGPSGGGSASEAARALEDMNAEFRSCVKVYAPYRVVARPTRASGWVNLRWAPSTMAERITTCSQGKELKVLAEMTNWFQVEDPATGMIGFIDRRYVSVW